MIYEFGSFAVDTERLELNSSGERISVQPQVFALIVYLIENRDRVVSKDDIIEHVWDGRIVSDGTLNARINAARRALGDNGEEQAVIRTFARRGFRFVADIDAGDQPSATQPTIGNRLSKPSLAVLPFVNTGGNPDEEFLADGITEELVTALAKLRSFFVTDRSTTFAYKGSVSDARGIAAELGVRYVVQGSVRTAGDRVRVIAQLTEAETGGQLWGERYDRKLTDIFAIQDEVTESLVGCLSPELYAAELARLRRRKPNSLDAWECFVHALHEYSQQSKDSSVRAVGLLRQAIELDPDYAQALGLLAITMSWRVIQRWDPYDETLADALNIARRAVAADANDPWASMGLGMVSMVSRDSATAILNFRRAVELSPNFAYAHAMLGAATAYSGDPEEAIRSVDTAVRLSPRDTFLDKFHVYYSLAYFQAGQYQQAAKAAEQAIQLKPEHANSHMLAASSYAHAGEQKSAESALATFKSLVPGTNASNVERAIAYSDPMDRARIADGLRKAGLND